MYIIRDREAGNEIERFEELEAACDALTEYVIADEAEKYDMEESDTYIIYDRRCKIMGFYEIYNTESGKIVDIEWDINDNCVFG